MNPVIYQVTHVVSVILLVAYTFGAFANPVPERRKMALMMTGIFSLLVLASGFGLIAKLHANNFAGWMIAKLAIWLVISAMAGMAFRMHGYVGILRLVVVGLVLAAAYLVYTRPLIFGM